MPLLLNTSFNVAGEPIVETVSDAIWCMLCAGLDACVVEGHMVVPRRRLPVLDYVLRLTATTISVTCDAGNGSIKMPYVDVVSDADLAALPGLPAFACSPREAARWENDLAESWLFFVKIGVQTPWGEVVHFKSGSVLRVLRHVDGKRTGRQVLAALNSSSDYPLDEPKFELLIGDLRRASAISLEWPEIDEELTQRPSQRRAVGWASPEAEGS